ncbi:hypothetical protein MSLAZ_1512 [Methanosarcina lacustris Z-7289]|uniref:Uncharacterized protein n=1 Tax=Methanosarcina lacustris Z-7289 TaxID=1434111 RepID=A0A0E3S6Z2_9EURY|nr:hypothetical protein [Methanosarcina lacustris]AKB74773.1 hypothetical protein MSLAZ_1512 [Methanosarcina lacustris Z-7289]
MHFSNLSGQKNLFKNFILKEKGNSKPGKGNSGLSEVQGTRVGDLIKIDSKSGEVVKCEGWLNEYRCLQNGFLKLV